MMEDHDAILVENNEIPEERKDNWKTVRAHTWPDAYYDLAVQYKSKGNKDPEVREELKKLTRKQKELFIKRMRYYTYDDQGRLVIHSYDIPPYIKDVNYRGTFPVVYRVVKESKIEPTLRAFLDNPATHATSAAALYDKVIRSNLLGITRDVVSNFLRSFYLMRRVTRDPYIPVIESFRPTFPFEYWQMDFIDYSKNPIGDNKGYKYVLVVIDIFSKFIYLYPTKQKDATDTINILKKIFLGGDIPTKLGSDNDKAFTSSDMRDFLAHFGVKQIFGRPHNPQTQGFVENKNKQIKRSLDLYMTKYKSFVFYDLLDSIAFSINTIKHSVTGLTPMEVHRGRSVSVQGFIKEAEAEAEAEDDRQVAEEPSPVDPGDYRRAYEIEREIADRRTNLVREKIFKEANRREEKLGNKAENYKVGDFVQIATWVKTDDANIRALQVRLHIKRFNGDQLFVRLKNPIFKFKGEEKRVKDFITDIKKYPVNQFKARVLTVKKWDWENFPGKDPRAIFIVKEKTGDSLILAYLEPHTDYRWEVHRLVDADNGKWVKDFHPNFLMRAPKEDIENYYNSRMTQRPNFGFVPVQGKVVPRIENTPAQQTPERKAKDLSKKDLSKKDLRKKDLSKKQVPLLVSSDFAKKVRANDVKRLFEKKNGETFSDYRKRLTKKLSLANVPKFPKQKLRQQHDVRIKYCSLTPDDKLVIENAIVLGLYHTQVKRDIPESEQLFMYNLYFPEFKPMKSESKNFYLKLNPNMYQRIYEEGGWTFTQSTDPSSWE